jgi:membrane-bound metal-dependent hydrolase YbcI (DUF457 family)
MALAYLIAKPTSKLLKTNLLIPFAMVFSILPDVDIIVPSLHRGPSHSLITALVIFIPIFALYHKKALPYFLALVSHSLIGDFLIGGQIQLLWPLTQNKYGNYWFYTRITDPANIALELTLFAIATIFMFKTKDLFSFFRPSKSNLILVIPILTVLLPTFLSYPIEVPILLVAPHLFYLVVFSVSALVAIFGMLKK